MVLLIRILISAPIDHQEGEQGVLHTRVSSVMSPMLRGTKLAHYNCLFYRAKMIEYASSPQLTHSADGWYMIIKAKSLDFNVIIKSLHFFYQNVLTAVLGKSDYSLSLVLGNSDQFEEQLIFGAPANPELLGEIFRSVGLGQSYKWSTQSNSRNEMYSYFTKCDVYSFTKIIYKICCLRLSQMHIKLIRSWLSSASGGYVVKFI